MVIYTGSGTSQINKKNDQAKYGLSPFLKEAQVSPSPGYENEVSRGDNTRTRYSAGGSNNGGSSGDTVTSIDGRVYTRTDVLNPNVSQTGSGDPSVINTPIKADEAYDRTLSKYFNDEGYLAYADGTTPSTLSQQEALDMIKNINKKVTPEDVIKDPPPSPVERHGMETTFTTFNPRDDYYDLTERSTPFHLGYDDKPKKTGVGIDWKPGTEYQIHGMQPSGTDHRYGNKTIADLVNSKQGAKKYNNVVARWQKRFLANALTGKVTIGQINQFVTTEKNKIDNWNISLQEKQIYKDDLDLRSKQIKNVLGKDNLSALGARKDPMDKFRNNPKLSELEGNQAIYTLTKGREGTAPMRILTYKDLGLGY